MSEQTIVALVDFGSTYTKVVAVDLHTSEVIGRSQAASTVNTDVREGLMQALATLRERHALFDAPPTNLKALEDKLVLAASSAAGGSSASPSAGQSPGLCSNGREIPMCSSSQSMSTRPISRATSSEIRCGDRLCGLPSRVIRVSPLR